MRNPKSSETREVLNIARFDHLSLQIGVPACELKRVLKNIHAHHKKKIIEEKKADGSIKERTIYLPSSALQRILSAIDTYLLKKVILPYSVHGARKGHSNVTNAKKHIGKKELINIDIENYYPSITRRQVLKTLRDLKCTKEVAKCITLLCTADNHVPQGYSTSPRLANLVLVPTMNRLSGLGKKQGLTVTGYVDDISVSGNKDIVRYKGTLRKIINDSDFLVNEKKVVHFKGNKKKKVTGVTVNSGLGIEEQELKKLRSLLFICRKYGPHELLRREIKKKNGQVIDSTDSLKCYLSGKIAYLRSVSQQKADKMQNIFSEINWPKSSL